jgi:hypothetical protein
VPKFPVLIILALGSILSSCGGGGGSGSGSPAAANPPPPNQAPTANAGLDQRVDEGTTVNLTGTGADSDGTIVSYSWQQVSGTTVTISSADTENTSFSAPMVSASEDLLFRLTVTDNDGATGSDTVTVTVNDVPIPPPPPPNQAPTANAGADQTVDEGTTVILAGTGADSDGTIVSYSWQQVSGTIVAITDSDMANASFTAPVVTGTQDQVFRFAVTDDDGATGSDTVTVTVNEVLGPNTAPMVTVDQPADGAIFNSNDTIILTGTATDAEDGTLSANIRWSSDQDGSLGTGATLSTTLSVATHILTASITDSGDISASASITVTVGPHFEATFTFPGGRIFGHMPVPQTNGFDYYFTPLILDTSILGDGVTIESIDVSAFGQNNGDVINFDWEVHIGPVPFGLPESQFIQTLVDPVSGYARIAPTQFRITIGNQSDTQSYLISGQHNFVTGTTTASPYFSVVHAAFTSPVNLTDGLYAQVFLWTADNRNSQIDFGEITLTIRGQISGDPAPNQSPTANAGADQTVDEGTTVDLSGTGADTDGTIASYSWEQESGTAVAITNANMANASFTAPMVTATQDLLFRLTVTDDDGATGSDTVTVSVNDVPISPPTVFKISGTISIPDGTAVDGDVNDPFAPFIPNDDAQTAQILPNPVTLGGYVNTPGTGEEGRSRDAGDISDVYRVNLIAGQTISLFVADPTVGDPDLYLWDSGGLNVIDASVNVGDNESLIVPFSGEFLVQAFAFDEASNYILVIGQTQSASAAGGFRLSDDFVPGEIIMRSSASASATVQQSANKPFLSSLDLRMKAGAADRAMLLVLDENMNRVSISQSQGSDPAMTDHIAALADKEQRQKLDTLMAIKALNRDPSVEYAHPNYIARAMAVPDDEFYPLQWHYPLINLPAAWDLTVGDPSVIVAVVDSGVLLNHPDLQGQLVAGYDFISNPQNSADGDGRDPDPDDPGDGSGGLPSTFHGTHVAGTVAARTNNGIGVAGVAGNAKIMPIRVLGVGGSGTEYDIIQGLRYAIGMPHRIPRGIFISAPGRGRGGGGGR